MDPGFGKCYYRTVLKSMYIFGIYANPPNAIHSTKKALNELCPYWSLSSYCGSKMNRETIWSWRRWLSKPHSSAIVGRQIHLSTEDLKMCLPGTRNIHYSIQKWWSFGWMTNQIITKKKRPPKKEWRLMGCLLKRNTAGLPKSLTILEMLPTIFVYQVGVFGVDLNISLIVSWES